MARSASLCAEQEQLLDELLLESLQALMSEDDSLSVDGLLPLSEAKRYALLRRWIACFGVTMCLVRLVCYMSYMCALTKTNSCLAK